MGTSFRLHGIWDPFGGQAFVVIYWSFPEATSNQSKLTLVLSNDLELVASISLLAHDLVMNLGKKT